MKKLICLLVALVLCMSTVVPVLAQSDFVPSITYKGSLSADKAVMGDKDVTDCLVITSIKEAKDKTTDITQEERDALLDVYKKLSEGQMELPLEGKYTIRDLVDVNFGYEDCRSDQSHGDKKEQLKQDGVTLAVDFDMNMKKTEKLKVLTYVDSQWKLMENVTINADGTVTVVFEEICPVAFCVERGNESNSQTGDEFSMGLWIGVLAVSVAAVAVLMANRRKITG